MMIRFNLYLMNLKFRLRSEGLGLLSKSNLNSMSMNLKELLNSGITELSPYEPGKPIEDLERELGLEDIVKIASNENPIGPSPLALKKIQDYLEDLHRYPDGNSFNLKRALSEKFNLQEDRLTIGNGSNDIIEFVSRCFLSSSDSAVFSQYAFAIYPLVIQGLGAEGIVSPATNWSHDLDKMLSSIKSNTKIIFIANPNNPTGTFLPKEELLDFTSRVPENTLVFLDQAYFDYSSYEQEDVTFQDIEKYPNLLISRTFSKAYGLAGLRVGFSYSSLEMADYLNRIRQPFNVNSLAQVAAETALSDQNHLLKSLELNSREKQILYKEFDALGFEYIPSLANFICFDCKGDADQLFQLFLKEGIIVRSMRVYGMTNHLRVTIGTEEENLKFINALRKLINE